MPSTARSDRPELLDAGDGRRLERFGPRIVDRPAPAAVDPRRDPDAWDAADLRCEPGRGWMAGLGDAADGPTLAPWPVAVDGLTLELRPTASGGLGLYPEHLANAGWLATEIEARGRIAGRAPEVLHLFAHTGLLTLAAARAGAAVAHVDSARTAVAWARRNAELSGLRDRPIRWLVDDVPSFVERERRRERRYDAIVLDPPSYGRARGRRSWRIADGLPDLLDACAAVLAPNGVVLLTAHTTWLDGSVLDATVRGAFPAAARIATSALRIDAVSGASLDLGWSVRLTAG